jgi:hypothetical protein
VPFALDAPARMAALEQAEAFETVKHQTSRWSLVLDPDQTVSLYATYSNIVARSDHAQVLAELHRIASDQFRGRVIRNMTTALYTARRRKSPRFGFAAPGHSDHDGNSHASFERTRSKAQCRGRS